MSDANKAAIRHAIEHFNDAANREAYFELYDENCALRGYEGVEPGLAGIKQFYRQFWVAFPDVQLTAEEMIAEDDRVACRFTFRATHRGELMGVPATGKRVTVNGMTILRFAAGRCIERWSQADFLSMLRQFGVAPQAGK